MFHFLWIVYSAAIQADIVAVQLTQQSSIYAQHAGAGIQTRGGRCN